MNRILSPAVPVLLASLLAASCQKVIDVNLNSAHPQYVVEGNVTDQPGPYTVRLTRTVNFSDNNQLPAVTGAFVTIQDETAGMTDTLQEDGPGYYRTAKLQGAPGHRYSLYIRADGRELTAVSTMPAPVDLDSIYTAKSVFGGDDLFPVPVYTDPPAAGNRYLITMRVNQVPIKSTDVRGDQITNGQRAQFPFYYDTDEDSGNPKIKSGDSVFATLRTIDSAVYEFYRTLEDTRDQNSAALANPLTNIRGGALGYFSAAAARTRGVLVR